MDLVGPTGPTAESWQISSSQQSSQTEPKLKSDITAKDIEDEKSIENPKNECIVCKDREVKCVFIPCMHICCCLTCASTLDVCPNCRGAIKGKKKVFL
jgi:hypothetical protein